MRSTTSEKISFWFGSMCSRLVLYSRQWLDSALAEDVVQEVFMKLVVLSGKAKEPENVRGWLFRAVRNASISKARSLKSHRERANRLGQLQPLWFEQQPDQLLDAQAAQAALLTLPANQREIVILRIWGQMTLRQIAETLEMPTSTVHGGYKVALAALRKQMEVA